MTKYKFTCDGYGTETTKTFSAEVLDDVISNFGEFLRGCGYIFDGEVGVIDSNGYNPYDELVNRLKGDDSYADVFQANIAMAISDGSKQKISHVDSNMLADIIMSKIFSINRLSPINRNGYTQEDRQIEFTFSD